MLLRVVLNHIPQLLDDVVSESQHGGFKRKRGTIDIIFAIRSKDPGKVSEQNQKLYILLAGLTKAFDAVSREGLLAITPPASLSTDIFQQHHQARSLRSFGKKKDLCLTPSLSPMASNKAVYWLQLLHLDVRYHAVFFTLRHRY